MNRGDAEEKETKEDLIMKKLAAVFVLLALILSLAACGSAVSVGGISSKYFNDDDYNSAVQELMTHFNGLEGCTLKKIGYAGDKTVKTEADARGLAPEQIMVLTAAFVTDGTGREDGLEPNRTYEDSRWILTRESSFDLFWSVAEQG